MFTNPFRLFRDRFWRASRGGDYEVRYAAGVSVWVRWLLAPVLLYILFQPPFPFPLAKYASYLVTIGLLVACNGYIHLRLRSGRLCRSP